MPDKCSTNQGEFGIHAAHACAPYVCCACSRFENYPRGAQYLWHIYDALNREQSADLLVGLTQFGDTGAFYFDSIGAEDVKLILLKQAYKSSFSF